MEPVDLPLKHMLVVAGEETKHVTFIQSGLGSIVASNRGGEEIEVGHIGREGMSGSHVILRNGVTPNRTFMQVAGSGIKVPTAAILDLLQDDPDSEALFLGYIHTTQIQLAYSALANGRFSMSARLARWLLMCHDRLESDVLPLTHEFLALMLGVRRAGVTEQVHILEGLHAIKAQRGEIRVINRPLLEEIAGSSYGEPERQYERLIGGLAKQSFH
jgi:CRP-like cAMP-binding protein